MEGKLSHFDSKGQAIMVDISGKTPSVRKASASGVISMNTAAYSAIEEGTVQKGDVLGIARVAGIMGAKRTSDLIPLCHPVATEKATIAFTLDAKTQSVKAVCTVHTSGKTGVEMEALCGVNIALLTVYDMCKALDKGMLITNICLLEKHGGKSGTYMRGGENK